MEIKNPHNLKVHYYFRVQLIDIKLIARLYYHKTLR